jgi:hypothetical protein
MEQVTRADGERDSLYGDWMVSRDTWLGYDDDYHPGDSWTAVRVIGGPWTRDRPVITTVRVHIHGVRQRGRLMPRRWWATVQVGAGYETPFVMPFGAQPGGSCVSLADAVRQAERSKELADLIARVTRDTYVQRENQTAMFRVLSNEPRIWNDPVPDGPPVIEPWAVVFRPIFGSLDGDLPPGLWVGFSWRRSYKPEPHWTKAVTLYGVSGMGGWSSCSPTEHARFVQLFPDWFVQPERCP